MVAKPSDVCASIFILLGKHNVGECELSDYREINSSDKTDFWSAYTIPSIFSSTHLN